MDAAIWKMPSAMKKAVSTRVSETAPSTGFQSSRTPTINESDAVSNVHRKAGTSFAEIVDESDDTADQEEPTDVDIHGEGRYDGPDHGEDAEDDHDHALGQE